MNKLRWFNHQIAEYGISVAIASLLNKVYFYGIHNDKLAYSINVNKHKKIISYLKKQYKEVIGKYKTITEYLNTNDSPIMKGRIWTIWWQGEESAPEHLKMCFNSMRKYACDHEVIVITKENVSEFISIPEHIFLKVENGNISFIHLADFIRMKLLSEYGGLWFDATIFLSDKISEEVFDYDYYTEKQERVRMSCVSEGRWNGTFFSGKPGFPFFNFMVDVLSAFWMDHEQIIDYFLIDYFTQIAYDEIPVFRKALDKVPVNNKLIFEMGKILNEKYDENRYNEITHDTAVHKMQRRNEYIKWTEDGFETYYGHLFFNIQK